MTEARTPEEEDALLRALIADDYRLADGSLYQFVKAAWPVIEPGTEFVDGRHIRLICDYLAAVSRGDIKRLIINIPPRYMKSIIVSVLWPLWEWLHEPETRWIFASYSASLSSKHSIDRRTVILSDWYQKAWASRFQLTKWIESELTNDRRGAMVATSVGATITGKGGTRIVIDDILNPQQAASKAARESALAFYRQSLSTRLDDKETGAIVIVMQRLHSEDLTGWALENQGGLWTHLNLPAIATTDECFISPGGWEWCRATGDLLWPERENRGHLAELKVSLGSYAFAAQYQQQPSPDEGGILKRGWWRRYDPTSAEFKGLTFETVFQSWDCAFKGLDDSDWVVGQVWGKVGALFYALDQVRGRWDVVRTMAEIRGLSERWPTAVKKLIEDKANGPAVITMLKNELGGIVAVNPQGGKEVRAAAVSPRVEAGNVLLPEGAPWVDDFILEAAEFPNGKNDDQVDAMTQAINHMTSKRGPRSSVV